MKKKILIVLFTVLFAIAGIYAYRVYGDLAEMKQANEIQNKVNEIIESSTASVQNESESDNTARSFTREAWRNLCAENNDFIGYFRFASGLIEQPIVQGDSNNTYLRSTFLDKTTYNSQGTPFMETNCTLNSDNITLYGHHVFYDETAMFSPLTTLLSQEGYEANEIIEFYLEDEIRIYQVAYVYVIDNAVEDYYYWQADFIGEDEFNDYLVYPNINNRIQSDVDDIAYGDHLLTLQTCYKHNTEQRLIVVAKEIARETY